MKIALASPRIASSLDDGLARVDGLMGRAADAGADLVCFPEAYLPGLRGLDFDVPAFDATQQALALSVISASARKHRIATIVGMEWVTAAGSQIVAAVVDAHGELLGYQTKNQLDPTEEAHYIPGTTRRLFEVRGVRFGIAIRTS